MCSTGMCCEVTGGGVCVHGTPMVKEGVNHADLCVRCVYMVFCLYPCL